jgi:hypothetical protein
MHPRSFLQVPKRKSPLIPGGPSIDRLITA